MTVLLQGLEHHPYGLEHPYEQAATERFPRNPAEGQPVAIGLATFPASAAECAWITWDVDGKPEEQRINAEWIRDDPDRSIWKANLPKFRCGQKISYRVHASCGSQQIDSGPFSFFVAEWHVNRQVLAYDVSSQGITITFQSDDPAFQPKRLITFPGPQLVKIGLTYERVDSPSSNSSFSTAGVTETAPFSVVEELEDSITLATDKLQVVIDLHTGHFQVVKPGRQPALVETEPAAWLLCEADSPVRVRQVFASSSGEGFYGFGERFNALNQRGNRLDQRVFEQYKNQGVKTYLPVSFLLSSHGYGVSLRTNRYAVYDLAATQPDRWSFEAELGQEVGLEYFIIVAEQPIQILRSFTDLTGKPKLPPAWVFGPWMSSNEWNSQARVMEQVELTLKHDIPASVLVIEAWSDESTFYIWNDAQYIPKPATEAFTYSDFAFPAEGRWPDPKGMIDYLHQLGIRVILWQIPVMKRLEKAHEQHDRDEAFMIEQGYCLHDPDGSPHRIRPFWFHGGLVWDPTHEQAIRWWMSKRAYLLEELEVDGFKTDGGEHLWGREVIFANGMRGDEGWNLYPNLYAGAYHQFAYEKRSGDAVTFSRAGFTGAQAYPCHWAGDENSTWEAFRASLLAGLNAGLSGIPFWGWDLAGFSGEVPSAELFLRSAEMATFCPIMQYHSEYNEHRQLCRDRTPWNIAERSGEPGVIEIYRKFAQLRMRLLPYITMEAVHCAETGEPFMRPLFLDWPEDPQAWEISDQYCFGRSLLVAPVLQTGVVERELYLPPGEWQDFWDGSLLSGGVKIKRASPMDIIPVYRRLDRPWPDLGSLNK